MNKISAFRDFLCSSFHNTSQAAKGFFRERKHQDAKLCCDWCSVYNSKMLIGPSKNIANNGKGMYVGLKQPRGTGSVA